MKRPPRALRIAGLAAIYVAAFAALDFALTDVLWYRLYPEKAYRIAHPLFHHALKPSFASDDAQWGMTRYAIRTDSLGFKDAAVRRVEKTPDRRRIVFLGDSFTEAIGMTYDASFVGQLAARFPQYEFLNAGLGSASPSLYWRMAKWLLDEGYRFDELFVYVDLSDIRDEAVRYAEDADGNIVDSPEAARVGLEIEGAVGQPPPPEPRFVGRATRDWLKTHFAYSYRLLNLVWAGITGAKIPDGAPPEAPHRRYVSYWTVQPNLPGYGTLGVEGGIAKAITYMDRLKTLLDARGIPLTVGVYPWPDQLDYDTADSRQVRIWRGWCAERGCARFIDHFPDFFAYKAAHPDWRAALFQAGDVHYGAIGNALMAERLATELAKEPRETR